MIPSTIKKKKKSIHFDEFTLRAKPAIIYILNQIPKEQKLYLHMFLHEDRTVFLIIREYS